MKKCCGKQDSRRRSITLHSRQCLLFVSVRHVCTGAAATSEDHICVFVCMQHYLCRVQCVCDCACVCVLVYLKEKGGGIIIAP